ncbi:helix-turn-helix domain-containing protein [Pontibacter silvestris]|uniref:Helix-turn-helix domain-containing protein n=1 Tax=Pontibacter silvestris TaxID=2305183 RepID=A0ABW4WYG3_9BACT|nr:helix-turn-helix domain-containing protein [Pontibacter silvestris]MCC9136787.1 helix-turn-helix domain-containing protein [Pontibacter silvestris]
METAPPATVGTHYTSTEKPMPLSEIERETIVRALEKNKGNISRTAKELGLTRTALLPPTE